MNKVGILGSGVVAQALGRGFLKHGYSVMLGSSRPEKLEEWKKQAPGAETGTFAQAALFGEIVALAVRGSAAESVLKAAGVENLKGKIVIDTCNPIADEPPVNGVLKFFTSLDSSLMERLQRQAPQARFVKAFNSIGSAFMVNPEFPGGKPTMFICGNDESAKKEAGRILDRFGFETEDMGAAEAARAIEPLCILWCIPGFTKNRWTHAFKLLKK